MTKIPTWFLMKLESLIQEIEEKCPHSDKYVHISKESTCPHGSYNFGCAVCLDEYGAKKVQEEKERITKRVWFLRQWLNEDRITDPNKLVTNEDLIGWLYDTR